MEENKVIENASTKSVRIVTRAILEEHKRNFGTRAESNRTKDRISGIAKRAELLEKAQNAIQQHQVAEKESGKSFAEQNTNPEQFYLGRPAPKSTNDVFYTQLVPWSAVDLGNDRLGSLIRPATNGATILETLTSDNESIKGRKRDYNNRAQKIKMDAIERNNGSSITMNSDQYIKMKNEIAKASFTYYDAQIIIEIWANEQLPALSECFVAQAETNDGTWYHYTLKSRKWMGYNRLSSEDRSKILSTSVDKAVKGKYIVQPRYTVTITLDQDSYTGLKKLVTQFSNGSAT